MVAFIGKWVGSTLIRWLLGAAFTLGLGSCVYFKIKNIGREEVKKEIDEHFKKAKKEAAQVHKDFSVKNKKRAAKEAVTDAAQKAKNLMDDVSR